MNPKIQAAIARHRPAIEALVEETRQYIENTKARIRQISDPAKRKRLIEILKEGS